MPQPKKIKQLIDLSAKPTRGRAKSLNAPKCHPIAEAINTTLHSELVADEVTISNRLPRVSAAIGQVTRNRDGKVTQILAPFDSDARSRTIRLHEQIHAAWPQDPYPEGTSQPVKNTISDIYNHQHRWPSYLDPNAHRDAMATALWDHRAVMQSDIDYNNAEELEGAISQCLRSDAILAGVRKAAMTNGDNKAARAVGSLRTNMHADWRKAFGPQLANIMEHISTACQDSGGLMEGRNKPGEIDPECANRKSAIYHLSNIFADIEQAAAEEAAKQAAQQAASGADGEDGEDGEKTIGKASAEDGKPGDKPATDGKTGPGAGSGSGVIDEPMAIETLAMPIHNDKRTATKSRARSGPRLCTRRLARAIATKSTQGLFIKRKRKAGVSILLDASGSMGWTDHDLNRVCEAAPASTIAFYSSGVPNVLRTRYPKACGTLTIYAQNSRRATTAHRWGGGNDVDLWALEWLLKQPAPRYFITDREFCGGPAAQSTRATMLLRRAEAAGEVTVLESLTV